MKDELLKYLDKNCVLTGSRGMGFEYNYSDYDYAITEADINNMIVLGLIKYTDVEEKGEYENKLYNKYNFKISIEDIIIDFIVYEDYEEMLLIKQVTQAVKCINSACNKDIRHSIFEFLCSQVFEHLKSNRSSNNYITDELQF